MVGGARSALEKASLGLLAQRTLYGVNARASSCIAAILALLITRTAQADSLETVESQHKPPPAAQPQPSGDPPPGNGPQPQQNRRSREDRGVSWIFAQLFANIVMGMFRSDSSLDEAGADADLPDPAIEPYDGRSIYVSRAERKRRIVRYAELGLDGNIAPTPGIYGHGVHLRGFISAFVLHGEWTRLHEPDAANVRSLDLFRGHVGANVLVGTRWAELYLLAGVLVMHGLETTPAFDMGLEARLYPARPLTLFVQGTSAFFEHGPPFFTARFEPGVSVSRIDLRLGATMIYQSSAISALGPSGSVGLRW